MLSESEAVLCLGISRNLFQGRGDWKEDGAVTGKGAAGTGPGRVFCGWQGSWAALLLCPMHKEHRDAWSEVRSGGLYIQRENRVVSV